MTIQDRFAAPVAAKKRNTLPENPEKGTGRFPSWLHRNLPKGSELWKTKEVMRGERLHTVCEEAKCPNLMQCWSRKTATFLVMGKQCTRACGFCDIDFAKQPLSLESDEPKRVADSVLKLGLKHVVITMVARDDIEDGGAAHLKKIVEEVRKYSSESTLELLTSDFHGNEEAWKTILSSKPEIFNHNLETVRELTPRVRHKATYDRSLQLLRFAFESNSARWIKSGLMLGLGETEDQVKQALNDLLEAGCQIVTMGQYLQPNRNKLRVKEFITPEQFESYAEYGRKIGIKEMYCGPFVRSSYNADQVFTNIETQD